MPLSESGCTYAYEVEGRSWRADSSRASERCTDDDGCGVAETGEAAASAMQTISI